MIKSQQFFPSSLLYIWNFNTKTQKILIQNPIYIKFYFQMLSKVVILVNLTHFCFSNNFHDHFFTNRYRWSSHNQTGNALFHHYLKTKSKKDYQAFTLVISSRQKS